MFLYMLHLRLVSKEDKDYFKGMLYEMLKSKFEVREEYDALFGYGKEIMFGASPCFFFFRSFSSGMEVASINGGCVGPFGACTNVYEWDSVNLRVSMHPCFPHAMWPRMLA